MIKMPSIYVRHRVSKRGATFILAIILANVD